MADRLPKLCRHKSTGRFYITLNGCEIYLGYHKAEARRKYDLRIKEWLANERRVAGTTDGLTIAELLVSYLRHAKRYYRHPDGTPTGQIPLVKYMVNRLNRLYGELPVTDFGPLKLEVLRNEMIGEGQSRTYINAECGRIKRAFKWAVSKEMIPPAIYQALTAVEGLKAGRSDAREPEPITAVDDATFQATLKFLPPVVADMARIERMTACRPGEVCTMRPADVDRSKAVWEYRPRSHKSAWRGKERVVPIGADAQPILAPYLDRNPEAFCFVPSESLAKQRAARHAARKTPMSCGNVPGSNRKRKLKRKPAPFYTTNAYSKAIRNAAKRAGVAHWSANRLRHAGARKIKEQHGIEAAAAVMGNTLTVAQRYAGHNGELAEKVMAERKPVTVELTKKSDAATVANSNPEGEGTSDVGVSGGNVSAACFCGPIFFM